MRRRYLAGLWRRLVEARGGPPQLDRWLAAELKAMPQLGSRDRRWYGDALFAAMRHAALIAHVCGDEGAADPGLAPDELWERIRRIEAERFVEALGAVLAAKGAPLDGDEDEDEDARPSERLGTLLARDDLVARCLAVGLPPWYAEKLTLRAQRAAFDVGAFLAALDRRPPVWLRVNDPRRSEEVRRALSESYPSVEAHGGALRIDDARGLTAHPVFRDGRVELQDLASQAIGDATRAAPGDVVWDACAGGGGKTVQLAARLGGRGVVYASDVRAYKLDETRQRAARAGFANVRAFPWSGDAPPTLPPEARRAGGFDVVLVDAPCSSAGTWRRSPDARFRLGADALAELTALQGRILAAAAAAVRPGGRLVYGTCSWLVEENEAVVERFLATATGWELEAMDVHGAPQADADTTFVATMTRKA